MSRSARVQRTTRESDVLVELEIDGSGTADVETGVPFFDHMLAQIGKHGGFDLVVRTKGDLEVDAHQEELFEKALPRLENVADCSKISVGVSSLDGRVTFAASAIAPLPTFARDVVEELGVLRREVR